MLRLLNIVNQLQLYYIYFRHISINGEHRRNLALQTTWLLYRGMLLQEHDQIKLLTREHLETSLHYILLVILAKTITYSSNCTSGSYQFTSNCSVGA